MKTLADRFWPKVEKSDGCWRWTAALNKGYGVLHVAGRVKLATHVAWFLTHDAWPAQLNHQCDNPVCVNPAHLSAGDQAANMREMARRGRHVGARRLTAEQVLEIRIRAARGETHTTIAPDYGVIREAVTRIANRKVWRNV